MRRRIRAVGNWFEARLRVKESVMPTALADALTVEEFGSLVSYLEGMKGK